MQRYKTIKQQQLSKDVSLADVVLNSELTDFKLFRGKGF